MIFLIRITDLGFNLKFNSLFNYVRKLLNKTYKRFVAIDYIEVGTSLLSKRLANAGYNKTPTPKTGNFTLSWVLY